MLLPIATDTDYEIKFEGAYNQDVVCNLDKYNIKTNAADNVKDLHH